MGLENGLKSNRLVNWYREGKRNIPLLLLYRRVKPCVLWSFFTQIGYVSCEVTIHHIETRVNEMNTLREENWKRDYCLHTR